eukprot:m.295570 g.295570  ORF g.295570 m.295570 type:complete len:192 (-) comp27181_c0_seq3:213-788(-)
MPTTAPGAPRTTNDTLSTTMKPITDCDLLRMEANELRAMMDRAGYTKEEKTATKSRRRRLQNRHSAKLSAARRQEEFDDIVRTNACLSTQMKALQVRNAKLEQETTQARITINQAFLMGEAYRQEIASLSAILLTQSVGVELCGFEHTTDAHNEASFHQACDQGPIHSYDERIGLQPFEYEEGGTERQCTL